MRYLFLLFMLFVYGCAGTSHMHIEAKNVVIDPGMFKTYIPHVAADELNFDHWIGGSIDGSQ